MKTRNAFTVIEVLLVIFIVALLGGMIFAVMGPVRESARQQVCVSNLQQIGQAVRMYRDDYGGLEPVKGEAVQYSELGLPPLANLGPFLSTYVKNRQVLFCPSYHAPEPLQHLGSTYAWAFSDGMKPVKYRFSEVVRRRGGEAPIVECYQHNRDFEGTEPRWEQKKVILLRLNGRVQARMVPIRSYSPDF